MRIRLSIFLVIVGVILSWLPARAQMFTPPTSYEYALMSQLAYDPAGTDQETLFARGWEEYLRSRADGQNDVLGYFGVAYINRATHQLVIAHRGTDQRSVLRLFSNSIDLDDDLALLRGRVPGQFQRSTLRFISRVYAQLNEDTLVDYTVSHTGHSLGAALAQMSALNEPVTGAVTFDSPGLILPTPPDPTIILSYVAAPNFVNTANRHPGRVLLIDVDWTTLRGRFFPRILTALVSPQSFLSSYVRYSLEAHSMDRILTTFDPATGEPKRALDVLRWWPLGVLASFRNYLFPKDMTGLTLRNRSGDAVEFFLSRLKGVETDTEFQNLVDQYVIRSRRFEDNLSDLYALVVLTICEGEEACIIRSTAECFSDEISLGFECVKGYAE